MGYCSSGPKRPHNSAWETIIVDRSEGPVSKSEEEKRRKSEDTHRMKLNILLAIAIGFFTLGCKQEQSGPQEAGEPAVATGGWVAQMMDTPEYANACAETPGCGAPQVSAAIETESVWRILLIREASGDVRIEWVEIINVMAGVLPHPGIKLVEPCCFTLFRS